MTIATATHKPSTTTLATADSSDYEVVEGNVYFPPASLKISKSHLEDSKTHTHCKWPQLIKISIGMDGIGRAVVGI